MSCDFTYRYTHTHTHPFNGPLSETTQVSRYQKGKTNLDFTEARDSEWKWHQLGHMQVCTYLQTDNNASTPPLCFLQTGCPSCRPTSRIKALKALFTNARRKFQSNRWDRKHYIFLNPCVARAWCKSARHWLTAACVATLHR